MVTGILGKVNVEWQQERINFMGQVSLTRSKGLSTKAKDQMEPLPEQVASFEIMFWMK